MMTSAGEILRSARARCHVRDPLLAFLLLFGVMACERQGREPHVAHATDTQAAVESWEAGVHYSRVEPEQQPAVSAEDKIEVIEFFWYGCAACYILEPRLVLWDRTKPDDVHLVYLPAVLSPSHRAHARLYYALKALGREDLHQTIYDTIHRFGRPLLAGTEKETFQQQREFAETHGIAPTEFTAAYHSAEVTAAVERAEQLAKLYRINLTPTMIVSGAYKTDMERAGGDDQLIDVVHHLVTRERRE